MDWKRIKAEYIANTSAIDLVGNELGDADTKTAMTFNQKMRQAQA